jgi:hypothetical protein
MSRRPVKLAFLSLVAVLGISSLYASQAEAKHKKLVTATRIASASSGSHRFFVPPPPPYVPSLLPELQYSRAYSTSRGKVVDKETTDTNPYGKYIYNRSGGSSPKPIQQNKYVTNWSYIKT